MVEKSEIKLPPAELWEKWKVRNYEHILLWIIKNNQYTEWRNYISLEGDLKFSRATLSKYLKRLLDKKMVKKESHSDYSYSVYSITDKGVQEYFNIMKLYNLGDETKIKEKIEKSKQIFYSTKKIIEELKIDEEEIKKRFRNYISILDYYPHEEIFDNKNNYYLTILYLSSNHPDEHPKGFSFEDFCEIFDIDSRDLKFYIRKIIEKDLYPVRFFQIKSNSNHFYYILKGERIEKMIRSVVLEVISKLLNETLEKTLNGKSEISIIVHPNTLRKMGKLICKKYCIMDDDLIENVIKFLSNYLDYLKYQTKSKEKTSKKQKYGKDLLSRLIPSMQIKTSYDISETTNEEAIEIIDINSKESILLVKDIRNKWFQKKNLKIIDKILILIEEAKYDELEELYSDNKLNFSEDETLILTDLIYTLKEQYKKSITITDQIIKSKPNESLGYYLQAITKYQIEDIESALILINRAITIEPNTFQFYFMKIMVLGVMERFKDIIKVNKEIYRKFPDLVIKIIKPIINLYDQLDVESFLDKLGNNFKSDRYSRLYYLLKSLFYIEANKFDEALQFIHKTLENNKDYFNLYTVKALIFYKRNLYEETLNFYEDNDIDFKNAPVILYQSLLNIIQGNFEDLRDKLKLELDMKPPFPDSYGYIARLLTDLERFEEAYYIMKNLDIKDLFMYNLYVEILINLNDYEKALEKIDEYLKRSPDSFEHLSLKVYLLAKLDNSEEIYKITGDVLGKFPFHPIIYENFGKAAVVLQNYDLAITDFKSIAGMKVYKDSYNYDFYRGLIELGNCYSEMGNFKDALKNLENGRYKAKQNKDRQWIRKANKYLYEANKKKSFFTIKAHF